MEEAKNFLDDYKLEGEELEVKVYPDPVLKAPTKEVTVFDEELETLCKNMLYTMYNAPGIGLAAPQIGVSKKIFVVDVEFLREETEEGSGIFELTNFHPHVFINPKITEKEGETKYEEGCLSVPGIYEEVKRAKEITIEYQNLKGEKKELHVEGLFSICIQHENDHLNGVIFIELLSSLKQKFVKKKFLRMSR